MVLSASCRTMDRSAVNTESQATHAETAVNEKQVRAALAESFPNLQALAEWESLKWYLGDKESGVILKESTFKVYESSDFVIGDFSWSIVAIEKTDSEDSLDVQVEPGQSLAYLEFIFSKEVFTLRKAANELSELQVLGDVSPETVGFVETEETIKFRKTLSEPGNVLIPTVQALIEASAGGEPETLSEF